ncbi:MAG TPA: mannose-1-phosphate guanylyltransferase [Deltaproteobacteria bacterium]|nr:mannose-1-phosphate guanylyltransferase [Deltaproteobacteria bacterium]HQB39707.1 mannose-1-phosphate guanylyltransferase [Deltaproteobacteria bacterium]
MYVVILAGGSGTRFWPLSRASRPKQLISIAGGKSMLQRTVDRVLPLKPKRIMVVTNESQAEETERQLAGYRHVIIDVIAEPAARNTAPAIGLAAAIIAAHDPGGVMAVLPADHFIRDEQAMCEAISVAVNSARKGYLATVGIVPSRPETGYGYIEADVELRGEGPFPVKRFVEKPPLEQALEYIEQGNFFWNSGMFAWRADVILAEIGRHLPELSRSLADICFNCDVWELSDLEDQIAQLYEAVASISIDYAVMEKSDKVQVVPAEMGWSDVGSWSALPEIAEADGQGNVAMEVGAHVSIDSSDCIIHGGGRTIATVGLKGVIVVATDDAVLVCDREHAQDVRRVVDQLNKMRSKTV